MNKGDSSASSILFREIVARFPFNFYSYMAQNRLIETTPANIEIINKAQAELLKTVEKSENISCDTIDIEDFKDDLSIDEKYYFLKAQNLIKVGFDKYASQELYRIQTSNNKKNILFNVSRFFHCIHDYHRSQYISRVYFQDHLEDTPSEDTIIFWKLAFPEAYSKIISKLSDHLSFSPYLILGLMRAESNFNKNVVSRAGAIGLMQIIPPTGKQIALKLNDNNFELKHLFDSKTNIAFGSWYFNSLIEKFDGNTILAIPSYNAGPHNVKRWIRQFGALKVDEFIETIPYNETRNYVKRVLRNYGVYKTLYSKSKSIIRLTQTMHLNREKLRVPAGSDENIEDWNQYKEGEDLRPKLLMINRFSLDKLSFVEYFSLNSFKKAVMLKSF